MAELAQPARDHRRANLFAVANHDPRATHADPLVGRLDELSTGCMNEPGDAVSGELLGGANIEEVHHQRTFTQLPLQTAEGEFVGTNFERKYRREGRPFYAIAAVKKYFISNRPRGV